MAGKNKGKKRSAAAGPPPPAPPPSGSAKAPQVVQTMTRDLLTGETLAAGVYEYEDASGAKQGITSLVDALIHLYNNSAEGALDVETFNLIPTDKAKKFYDQVRSKDLNKLTLGRDFSIYDFLGFDPKMVWKHYMAIQIAEDIPDDEFLGDIAEIIVIHLKMGNITKENTKKRSDEGQERIELLTEKYSLQHRIKGDKQTAVNAPRTAAAFPLWTIALSGAYGKEYSGPMVSSQLPSVMWNSAFPAILPRGEIGDFVRLACLGFSVDQALSLKGEGSASKTAAELAAVVKAQATFVDAARSSISVPDSDRESNLRKSGIKDHFAAISAVAALVGKHTAISPVAKSDWDTFFGLAP